jgi:hypothetical protein
MAAVAATAAALAMTAWCVRGARTAASSPGPPDAAARDAADTPPAAREQRAPDPPRARFRDSVDVSTFQKGNIHAHTRRSDGDSHPERVIAWYRAHGYAFMALTDHNIFGDPARYRHLEQPGAFVILSGEEITMHGARRQVHVNAVCASSVVGGKRHATQSGALSWAVAQVHQRGGVALVNHPNWDWALSAGDLDGARGAELIEIASGHPGVQQDGDGAHPSHEALWDAALSAGLDFAPAAVDDAHNFAEPLPRSPALPGGAWVQVFAKTPARALLCDALRAKQLYASTGAEIARISVEKSAFTVWPAEAGAEVAFIGNGGKVLALRKPAASEGARYEPRGDELYVRARVTNAAGRRAWTPAYFLER